MSAADETGLEVQESRDGGGHGPARETYATAVSDGFYRRQVGGLYGKHDNVRRYWEDQITRYALREFVEPLVQRKRRSLSRIRVLDLGAGAGEGYETLTNLKKRTESLASKEVDVLPTEMLGRYKGLDISPAMVGEGRRIYPDNQKVRFTVGDLKDGLEAVRGDPPFDIYFSSYGSLSHLSNAHMRRTLKDIYDHCADSCIFVADLLGRYSLEWPCYWERPDAGGQMRPYSMSYLYRGDSNYPADDGEDADVAEFPLRYWGGREFDELFRTVIDGRGGSIRKMRLWDRSVLVGRHMDTAEFNPRAQPIRRAVNSLHEFDRRTDLERLLVDYQAQPGFPGPNEFLESFQMAWNAVVYAAIEALEQWDDPDWLRQPPSEEYPAPVFEAIRTIRNVVRHIQWLRMGDPRANVVEPQLGYILRNLEMDLQQGLGCAHSLLAIYEVEKPSPTGS